MRQSSPNFFSLCATVVRESKQTHVVSGKTSADFEEKSVKYQAFINDHTQSIFSLRTQIYQCLHFVEMTTLLKAGQNALLGQST